jgi:hypothetical protein
LLAAACDKRDPLGEDRFNPAHRGVALAGMSTLNRLELSNNKNTRTHKLAHQPEQLEACLLQMGVRCLPKYAEEIVVDLDAMGHRLHGTQEGRHFRAYYDEYVRAVKQRLSLAGPVPTVPSAADGAGARRRLTPAMVLIAQVPLPEVSSKTASTRDFGPWKTRSARGGCPTIQKLHVQSLFFAFPRRLPLRLNPTMKYPS